MEIFWGSGSQFSWRVLLALEWKRLSYESRLLSFAQGEHKSPAFLALNPRGRVPTLKDGDVVVYESIAILAYLDRAHPERPLFGATAADAAVIWQTVAACVSYLDGPVEDLILPFYRGTADAHAEAIDRAIPVIDEELRRHEAALARGPWLAGAAFSAADCTVYPLVKAVLRAATKPQAAGFVWPFLPLEARLPRVDAWMKNVEALPGYDRTYPPHWRG